MRFSTFILRNLLHRKARSALTIVGVGVAVAAVVALVGIADGFQRSFAELYERRGVDLMVVRAGTSVQLASSIPDAVGQRLKRLPGVRAISPGLMDVVTFEEKNLIGVPLQGWAADSFLFDSLKFVAGRRLQADDRDGVMLGTILAQNLGARVGQTVTMEGQPFRVIGIYESFSVFENGSAVVLLPTLQKLMDRPNQVTGYQVVVEHAADKEAAIQAARRRIEGLTDDQGRSYHLSALPTQQYVQNTNEIRQSRAMAWLTSVIALIIGAVGVLNTMVMAVFERTREIGILRAIGWRPSRVVRMILSEAVLLSVAGAVAGTLAALGLTRMLTALPAINGYVEGRIAPVVMAEGFVVALLVALAGGLYPALRAARLQPTEALRHE